MLKKYRLMSILGTGVFVTTCASSTAFADEAEKLEDVVVTGTAYAGAKNTVSTSDIEAVQATAMGDLFRTTPGVSVSGGGTDTIQKFYVRGLEDQNLNVTIDGARQPGTLFRHQSSKSYTDPDLLKKVDINAGTGGALNGAGALGGSVKFVTKDAEDLLLPGRIFGVTEKMSYFSNGNGFKNSITAYGKPMDTVSYVVALTKQWSDDYSGGNNQQVPFSASEPINGLAKLKLNLSEDQVLKFGYDHRVDDGVRTSRPNFGYDDEEDVDSVGDRKMERQAYTLNYAYAPSKNPYVDLTFDAYRTQRKLTRGPDLWPNSTGSQDLDTRQAKWISMGYDARNSSRFSDLTLTYGTDYSWDKSTGKNKSTGEKHSEKATNLGLYAQMDYSLTDDWSVYGGLRFDHAVLEDYYGSNFTDDHLSPSFGTEYQPLPWLNLFGERTEASRGILPVGGMTLLNGPDVANYTLDAEGGVAVTWQGGAKIDWNGWDGDLTLFRTKIRHYSNSGGARGLPFYRSNDGKIITKGFTANAGYSTKTWGAHADYTHYDMSISEAPAGPTSFNYGSPHGDRLGIKLDYKLPEYDVTIGWRSSFTGDIDIVEDGQNVSRPGYDVHDFIIGWVPMERMKVSLSALNIFDERYINHSTPYTSMGKLAPGPGAPSPLDLVLYDPGRDIRLTVAYKF